MTDDSEDELSTDSSCEDLPVPHLRSHIASPFTAFPNSPSGGVPMHLNPRPGQPVPPPTAMISNQQQQQQHRYLKNGQGQAGAHPKVSEKSLNFVVKGSSLGVFVLTFSLY